MKLDQDLKYNVLPLFILWCYQRCSLANPKLARENYVRLILVPLNNIVVHVLKNLLNIVKNVSNYIYMAL